MRFDLITLFPGVVGEFARLGVTGEACRRGRLALRAHDLRDYAGPGRRPDDSPYGGGAGMLLQAEPVAAAVEAAQARRDAAAEPAADMRRPVLALGPQGAPFTQADAEVLCERGGAVIVCGRYEGLDERAHEAVVDAEYSLGDFILSGAELPALCIVDACARLLPGVLGAQDALDSESFVDDSLEFPQYTRPSQWRGHPVPAVLLSGDHAAIARWRRQQALGRTFLRRPDLLDEVTLSEDDRALLRAFLESKS